jgi:hypothetical protein
VECILEPLEEPVGIDAAVPLALWMVEAGLLIRADGPPVPLEARLEATADEVRLLLHQPEQKMGALTDARGMLRAIARQLGGQARIASSGDQLFACMLAIPRPSLAGMQVFQAS